jgi:hypothetical protein
MNQETDQFSVFHLTRGHSDKDLRTQNMPRLEGTTLFCMAVLVDKVCRTGPCILTQRLLSKNDTESKGWLLWLFDLVLESRIRNRGLTGYDLFLTIVSLLVMEGTVTKREPTTILRLLVVDMEYFCEIRRGLKRAEFADGLCKELSAAQTDGLLMQCAWSYSRAFREGKLNRRESQDMLIYLRVLLAVNKLCIAYTNAGHVGLLPPLAQVGDIVGVIQGFSLPAILRKSGNDHVFVGACHMPGYMEGEAAVMLQKEKPG